ncbi:MAG: Fic family protein [bacterium]|nr:Fic family protein [bacterium]
MKSLNLKYLNDIRLTSKQVTTVKKIGEYKGKQALFARQTPEILESLKQVAQIESSESSNRIEGVVAQRGRVKALVAEASKPRDRSEQEIAGYRDSLELVHDSASYMALSVTTILHVHKTMYRYLPENGGEWKQRDNAILEINPDGTQDIRFAPVRAAETPQAMETLVQHYGRAMNSEIEPMFVIPLTILDFLCVHPFTDGNGRVSRLLTLMLLYHREYQVGHYISLERVIEDSKETYYEALKASSQGWHESMHDPMPWLQYFWGVILRAYKEFEERVGEVRSTKISKTEQVRMAVNRKIGQFAISDIESECPHISRDMIKLVMRDLRDEGAITVKGKGRGAKWVRNAEVPVGAGSEESKGEN